MSIGRLLSSVLLLLLLHLLSHLYKVLERGFELFRLLERLREHVGGAQLIGPWWRRELLGALAVARVDVQRAEVVVFRPEQRALPLSQCRSRGGAL